MNKKFVKTIVLMLLIVLILTSLSQATVTKNKKEPQSFQTLADDYYSWRDDFSTEQKIDESLSQDYEVKNGNVRIYGTYPEWNDPSFTKMKKITLSSNKAREDCPVKLTVNYDSDMRSDYGDLRFQYEDENYFLDYWIESKNPNPNNPYAIVWIKIPYLPSGNSNVFMFYGKPSATDQSDYWAVFDENSWSKKHTHDHQVTYHMASEGAWDPDVCYGGSRFLVTWEEGIPYAPLIGLLGFKQQIRGCFYDSNGNRQGNRFDITPWFENQKFRNENPSCAYGGGKYFVAYEHYTNPINNNQLDRDIKGAIVTSSGSSSTFDICTATNIQADPCVVYDNDHGRFFVVWEDGRSGTNNYDIYGQFYSSNGQPQGSEIALVQRSNVQCEPWITYDNINDHFMLVWEESSSDPETGPFDIWGQLFDYNGGALGNANANRLSPTGGSKDYNFPCVAFQDGTEQFLVTWQEDDISSNDWYGHIYGVLIDENGNVDVPTFKIAHGEFERTDVVAHLNTQFFVAYDSYSGDIYGKLVNSDGSLNGYELQLSDSESDPADWCNIASSGNKIYVAWEDTRIDYPDNPPWNNLDMPDVFSNLWSFDIPSDSDVSVSFGNEKSIILSGHITSVKIKPTNLESWYMFGATSSENVVFDILDGENPNNVLKSNVAPGSNINSVQVDCIRLKASFTRNKPSSSPTLSMWKVEYIGVDSVPPRTTIDRKDGTKEPNNDIYTSESVIVWLKAEDFPTDTGSGVDKTYYEINNGATKEYNTASGIFLSVDSDMNWYGRFTLNYWSVDNQGNSESKEDNEETITIDAEGPEVKITSPADEQKVEVPFIVTADATDNYGIARVEFDIEPFGEREDLPFVDDQEPYEWYCDVDEPPDDDNSRSRDLHSTGVNVMVRARAFDHSGQSHLHEVWVYVKNWNDTAKSKARNNILQNTIINLFKPLKIDFNIDKTLNVQTDSCEDSEKVVFKAQRIFTKRTFTSVDDSSIDGYSASFNVPTGVYKVTSDIYSDNKIISSTLLSRVIFIKE